MRTAPDGRGMISVLELPAVQDKPRLFSTALMWLLAELFEQLPEAGDLDRPKLVFFFDEAHLLFADATDAFLESVTQTVRLIRSKGVGVFFVTQVPDDVPAAVLGQLGNRVQHALRAFTPDDAKALKAAASTYPKSDLYDVEELLTSMGIGEAAVTTLSDKGVPTPVVHTRLRAPASRIGPAPDVDGAAKALAALRQVRNARGGRERAREARGEDGEGDGCGRRAGWGKAAGSASQGGAPGPGAFGRRRGARGLPELTSGQGNPEEGAARRLRHAQEAVLSAGEPGRLRRLNRDSRLVKGARLVREWLPGDERYGDPLSTGGRRPSEVAGRQLSELTVESPGVVRELGLGAVQVWQALAEAQGRGRGEVELAIVFTDLSGFSTWALDKGDTVAVNFLRDVGGGARAAAHGPRRHDRQAARRWSDGRVRRSAGGRYRGARGERERGFPRSRRLPPAPARGHPRWTPAPAGCGLPRRGRERRSAARGRRGSRGSARLEHGAGPDRRQSACKPNASAGSAQKALPMDSRSSR